MKSIAHLVEDGQNQKAWALRLRADRACEYRIGYQWVKGPKFSASSVHEMCLSILNDRQKDQLLERGLVEGWMEAHPSPVSYQIHLGDRGASGRFHWHLEGDRNLGDWSIPPFLLEKWSRQSGLTVIYGPIFSGKSTLLRLLARQWVSGNHDVVFFSDVNEFPTVPELSVVPSESLLFCDSGYGLGSTLFVDSRNPLVIARALRLASNGCHVFVSVSGKSVSAALLRLQAASEDPEKLFWPLLADTFLAAVGTRLIPGLESSLVSIFELLTDTQQVTEEIRKGSVFGLVEIMGQGGDTSGMRTLNQAILQLLIKRKIELRVGFDESPHPQELDQLLRKVGV